VCNLYKTRFRETLFPLVNFITLFSYNVKGTPTVIWKNYSKSSGLNKETFFEYYSNVNNAVGILLTEIQVLENEISLKDFKVCFPKFSPPQTFKYSTAREMQRVLNLTLI
jgi:hypothetical protein